MPASPTPEPTQTLTPVNRWKVELEASKKFLEKFHSQGKKVVDRFIDERSDATTVIPTSRLNLFHANIITLLALMYEKLPKVEADRRFADPNDDVARVAGEMVTRILQNDMNRSDNDLKTVLKHALWDRLVPGLGVARVKYCFEENKEETPVATIEGEDPLYPKKDEWCEEVYVHWQDYRYSPCRTREEKRWEAFRCYMTREEATKRFGKEKADSLSYTSTGPAVMLGDGKTPVNVDKQAEVWEIWDKDAREVYWWAEGAQDLLDTRPDPLKLTEFFPSAEPMAANLTTSKYIPRADFVIAQDIYSKIDQLETRLALLIDACKAVGVYAGDSEAVKNMLQEGSENQLVPVDNWAMYMERGGLKGSIEWFPIREIAEVIQILTLQQQAWIQKLYQVTGMSDILRGQATTAGTTATEQKIKAQFGSVRISALQNEFAAFAQDLLNKKVQIIRNFYDPQRIIALSNIEKTPDAAFAQQAIELIKNGEQFDLRIAVRADSMAAVDLESLKQERTQFLQAMSQFIGQATEVATTMPEIIPFLMQLMRFGLAGFKSSSEMEGVVDQAIAKAEEALAAKAQQPPQPSPEEKKLQMEGQLKQQEFQLKAQDMQNSSAMEMRKQQFELQMKQKEFELEQQRARMELEFKREELLMKQRELDMKLQAQQAQTVLKIQSDAASAEMEHEHEERRFEREDTMAAREEARAQRGFEADQKRQDQAAKAAAKREPE